MSALAAAEIRSAILSGKLAPAARIRQEDLAERLGVSREPIRHALLLLEREGLVRIVPKHGAIVTPLERKLMLDIYDLREAVEPYVAAKLAGQKGFDSGRLREILKQGRTAVASARLSRLIELDLEFHNTIYRAAGNETIADIMRIQFGHLRRAVHTILSADGYPRKAWDEHNGIVNAIVTRRPKLARAVARAHIKDARRLLAKRFAVPGE
jgi:DNA-binding GntR family transcriptional regulator